MPTVRLPAPFLSYACRRTLVCCSAPIRAPTVDGDQTRIAAVLASTDAGRAYLPIFTDGFEPVDGMNVMKQPNDGRCTHLRVAPDEGTPAGQPPLESGCSLQFIGGFEALTIACRDYPRWIATVPPAEGSEVEIEAVFLMACPTAATLLVEDPSPFRWVEVPRASWSYPPVRETQGDVFAAVRDLRAGWGDVLAERRDATWLFNVLSHMAIDPMNPPAEIGPAGDAGLGKGFRPYDLGLVHNALERLPGRGERYASLHWDLLSDLSRNTELRPLHDAIDIAPELLTAFLDHLIPFAGVHDSRPVPHWLRTAVRRTVLVARMADFMLARVPFGIDTLFADLIAAGMHLDATATPAA